MNPLDRDSDGVDADATGTESAPVPPSRQPLPEPAAIPPETPAPGLLQPPPQDRPERAPEPARPADLEPAPAQPEPPARPAEEPKPGSPEPAKPAPEPKPRPEDENLFEVLSGWRARRSFPVSTAGGTAAGKQGHQAVGHAEERVGPAVPRVPFDPAAETRRLRSAR